MIKTTDNKEQLIIAAFPRLLSFVLEMQKYQKSYNEKCQCEDCSWGEPTPAEIITTFINKYFATYPDKPNIPELISLAYHTTKLEKLPEIILDEYTAMYYVEEKG